LEQYAYTLKQSITEEGVKDKLSDEDKKTIEGACEESIRWIESHLEASKDEFEAQKKKLEEVCMPIMSKIYAGAQGGGGGGTPFPTGGQGPSEGGQGPSVSDFDVD